MSENGHRPHQILRHLVRWGLLVLLEACAAAAVAGAIYGYTDQDGRQFLSNIPDDPRYVPLVEDEVSVAHRPSEATLSKPAIVQKSHGSPEHQQLIVQAARDHQVDADLIRAVVAVESGHVETAVSYKGAAGLMQLMPETASRYGITDRLDPAQNLDAGTRHLRYLLDRFNCDVPLALAAYNAGEGAVKRHGNSIPPYRETMAYVPKVMRIYENLRVGTTQGRDVKSPQSDYSLCSAGVALYAANQQISNKSR